MKISAKTQYGLRAMVYLARAGKISSLKEISENEKIPFDFLEKIISKLEKAKLVKSKRGAQGGYILLYHPSKITTGEIIKVLERTMAPVLCIEEEENKRYECPHKNKCLTKNVWKKVQDSINRTLNSITLEDLLNKK